ncbi:MAG: helix-turn-helix domain-containing protein, partial [Planctomycetaceae bacterium]
MNKSQVVVRESEEELVEKAQQAVSSCNWVVGECATKWTQKYARGRTDTDFAVLVGLSPDQVYQRRRVWETFGDVCNEYASLKWSHFYVALNWDDAPECLQWAQENEATVAEMKAWRRAQRGEDLTEEASDSDWGGEMGVQYVPDELTAVRDPGRSGGGDGRGSSSRGASAREPEIQAAARESDGGNYSPFRSGAGSPAPKEQGDTAVAEKSPISAEQLASRMISTLERMYKAL